MSGNSNDHGAISHWGAALEELAKRQAQIDVMVDHAVKSGAIKEKEWHSLVAIYYLPLSKKSFKNALESIIEGESK
jgi:hypothetical protein